MLQQMGVTVPPAQHAAEERRRGDGHRAAAAVRAAGQALDVNVSSMGNAKSLRGGTLIATPLKGADGQIYALAQGNLIVGGAGASAAGSKVHQPPGGRARVPRARPWRARCPPLNQGATLQLDLAASDYGTARDVAKAINGKMGEGVAQAIDGRWCACACRRAGCARGLPGRH